MIIVGYKFIDMDVIAKTGSSLLFLDHEQQEAKQCYQNTVGPPLWYTETSQQRWAMCTAIV